MLLCVAIPSLWRQVVWQREGERLHHHDNEAFSGGELHHLSAQQLLHWLSQFAKTKLFKWYARRSSDMFAIISVFGFVLFAYGHCDIVLFIYKYIYIVTMACSSN